MTGALNSSDILGLIQQDSELGAAALKYATPEVRQRLNLLVKGIFAIENTPPRFSRDSKESSPVASYTLLGIRDAYLEFT